MDLVCGTEFESLKNEKKASVYRALKICPMYVKSQARTMSCRVSISMSFFSEALKDLCSVTDF